MNIKEWTGYNLTDVETQRAFGNVSGKPRGGKYVLRDGTEEQYAKHLNDFIKYCKGQGVNLGADMVSLNGTPQLIDAPYLFEDSGINAFRVESEKSKLFT